MDSALDGAAQPGLGVGAGRRRADAPRQPPPEHRRRTRPTRRPTARSRSRPATTACSRGCARRSGCRTCPPTRASRPTRRAWRTSTRSPTALDGRVPHPPGRPLGRVLRAAGVPVGPINRVDEAFALAAELRDGARSTTPRRAARSRPPLRLDGERPPDPPRRRRELDEHGDEIRTGCDAAAGSTFGSMKRTSSRRTSNVSTSRCRGRGRTATSRSTSSSGALAPEEMPTTRAPSSHSSCTCVSLSIRWAAAPQSRATSTRRCELDEFVRADDEHEVALRRPSA